MRETCKKSSLQVCEIINILNISRKMNNLMLVRGDESLSNIYTRITSCRGLAETIFTSARISY